MGVSGSWAQRSINNFAGAGQYGHGINPIHGVRDQGRGRNAGPPRALSNTVDDNVVGRDIDYVCDDYVDTRQDEVYAYVRERPSWTEVVDRGSANGFPGWGEDADAFHAIDHGEAAEQHRAIAVPEPGSNGGLISKLRGAIMKAMVQDPTQKGFVPTINTSDVQGPGVQTHNNDRAVARGTDNRRAASQSRVAGGRVKTYAPSFAMGGGPGAPDMRRRRQTPGWRRPFVGRIANTAPVPENMMWAGMESRTPIFRTQPQDPYQGQTESLSNEDYDSSDWGY